MVANRKINILLGYLLLILWPADLPSADRNVGCFFNPNVCELDEDCFDDNAFGRCQNEYDSDNDLYRHSLSSDSMELLEKELTRLFVGGYRWEHDYTQCVVQNILYAKRHKVSYDPGLCSRIMQMTLPEVPPELISELETAEPDELALIKFTPERNADGNFVYADENFVPPLGGKQRLEDSEEAETPLDEKEIIKKRNSEATFFGNFASQQPSDRDNLFQRIYQVAKDTENLLDEDELESRLPSSKVSAIEAPVPSDLDHNPSLKDEGFDWMAEDTYPVKDDQINDFETDASEREGNVPLIRERMLEDHRNRIPFVLEATRGSEGDQEQQWRSSADLPDDSRITSHIPDDSRITSHIPDDSRITSHIPDDSRITSQIPDDDDEPSFRWNMRHYNPIGNDALENIGFKSYSGNAKGSSGIARSAEQTDYLEDNLRAIFPFDKDFSMFQRPVRYDTKKPGPSYFYHDDEDGVSYEDDIDDSENISGGEEDMLPRLMGESQRNQLNNLLLNSEKEARTPLSGFTEVQEDERLKELIHIRYAPELSATSGKDAKVAEENDTLNDDAVLSEKRMLNDVMKPGTAEGIFPYMRDSFRQKTDNNMEHTDEGHPNSHVDSVDVTHVYLLLKQNGASLEDGEKLVKFLEKLLDLPRGTFSNIRIEGKQVIFKVNPNLQGLNASDVAAKADEHVIDLQKVSEFKVENAGIGDKVKYEVVNKENDKKLFILTFALCGAVVGVSLVLAVVYIIRRHARSKEKLQNISQPETEPSQDYQDLCRQRMASKTNEGTEGTGTVFSPKKVRSLSQGEGQTSSSSHSSTSSWNEEPVTSNMDISTGHMILSYMEDHLKKKDRLDREWEAMCAYEAEPCSTANATQPQNIKKNRYPDVLPYDHSRVVLNELSNVSGSDYINASSITDHDPRNPAYIATQGPLPHTAADFWQMIWEQGSVVMVMLTRLMENGVAMCHRYWPEEGSEVYHIYEVHLVSEHIWCDVYLVRSFYLKNLRTGETRTVTQFHFLSWPDNGVPNSTKALLEFRRKVNKSYRGRSCPIVVHCSDGIGRTGTYILIDMVLNRMAKGAKEIDIAATLEHIRDQRGGMVKTKAQFEFVLMAIAEEVHAILKALSQ